MSIGRSLCGIFAVTLGVLPALSASAAGPAVPGEAKVLAGPCATCHGQDGRSPGSIVGLYGRPAAALAELLELYRTKALTGTVMNRITAGYTPDQLRLIAQQIGTKE